MSNGSSNSGLKFVVGLLVAIIVVGVVSIYSVMGNAGEMMFAERTSPYNYETTIEKVKQGFESNKWSVMSVKDSNAGFVKKGKALRRTEVCGAPSGIRAENL